jgi:putative methionine-R-sulfoxide reductase with GAF domain
MSASEVACGSPGYPWIIRKRTLMHETTGLSDRNNPSSAVPADRAPSAPGTMQALQTEKLQTRARIMAVEEQLEISRGEQMTLAGRLSQAELRFDELQAQLSDLEARRESLEALEVAADRLLGSQDREEAVAILMEIVAALVGSEEVALYQLDREQAVLELVSCYGISVPASIALDQGIAGQVASSGREFIAESPARQRGEASDSQITICAPLTCQGETAGVLIVYGLVPQKHSLENKDLVIVRFLEQQAAGILFRDRNGS